MLLELQSLFWSADRGISFEFTCVTLNARGDLEKSQNILAMLL